MSVEIIKLASPLYKLQEKFYITANRPIDTNAQDQILMENIAVQLRKINPKSLVDNFNNSLKNSSADVILNDDVREYETDYKNLKYHQFIFILVVCDEHSRIQRLKTRNDISFVENSTTTKDIDKFEQDYIIDTTDMNQDQLKSRLCKMLLALYSDEV